jgi:hypothetical protein
MSGERNFSISVPSASAFDSRGIWLRNSNFSRMSWTFGENPSRIGHEVVSELLLARPRLQVRELEGRGVVKILAGGLAQRLVLIDDLRGIQPGLHLQDGRLGRLQHRVEAAQDGHRQDHVAILAANIKVAQDVVGDPPDEVGDPVQIAVRHRRRPLRSPVRR